jgi:uncharacterized protein YkwD
MDTRRHRRRRRLTWLCAAALVAFAVPVAAVTASSAEPLEVTLLPADETGQPQVRLSGWLNEGPGGEAPQVRVEIDGKPAQTAQANGRSRQRWELRGPRDERGFGLTFPLPSGTHEVCVAAEGDASTRQCTNVMVPGDQPTDSTAADAATSEGEVSRAPIIATAPADDAPVVTDTPPAEPAPPVPPPSTAPETQPKPAPPATPAPPANTTWQAKMIAAVNAERAKQNLQPVTACASLGRAAQGYADTMAVTKHFDHTGADGSTLSSRTKAAGYITTGGGWSVAENIAAGYTDVASVMKGWMNSAGHRANIMAPELRHIGVGWATNGNYWVQDFGAGGAC